jgi:hypothetical protein
VYMRMGVSIRREPIFLNGVGIYWVDDVHSDGREG